MELTGSFLPWLIAMVWVTLFVLNVMDRPRWRSAIVRGATRGICVVLLSVLALAQGGVILNNQYGWYSSWADLLGGSNTYTTISGGGAGAPNATIVGPGIPQPQASANYALAQPGQQLQQYSVRDSSGQDMQVLVHLPVGYDPSAATRYPVVLGLHGYPGVPTRFLANQILPEMDAAAAAGTMAKAIVVIPQINNPPTRDTECLDGPAGSPQTETWLSKEVPQWIVDHFHVRADHQSWAAIGYSFGGWCAAFVTMRHPSVFGAAIVFAGYFRPSYEGSDRPYTPQQLESYNLVTEVAQRPPNTKIWLFASEQDPGSYPTSKAFVQAARAPTQVKATFVAIGGHRNDVWAPSVPRALTWLTQVLPGFRA